MHPALSFWSTLVSAYISFSSCVFSPLLHTIHLFHLLFFHAMMYPRLFLLLLLISPISNHYILCWSLHILSPLLSPTLQTLISLKPEQSFSWTCDSWSLYPHSVTSQSLTWPAQDHSTSENMHPSHKQTLHPPPVESGPQDPDVLPLLLSPSLIRQTGQV